jgi:predicted metal-dependent hydrolase
VEHAMKSRPVDFNFSGVSTFWAENKDFALFYNGASLVDPPLEIYLCRCMLKAKDLISDPRIKEDVQVFIQQETAHYKGHTQFNNAVAWKGVDTKPVEKELIADYDRLLKNRSLRFNLAYCEGFESTSVIPMETLFNELQDFWKGTHPKVEAMWKWHFAEEHEHRNSVHDAYVSLYGRGPIAWAYRVCGLIVCMKHMYGYASKFQKLFFDHYRRDMTPEQLAESKAQQKRLKKLGQKNALKHLLRIMSPFYSPKNRAAPEDVHRILQLDKAPAPIPGSVSHVSVAAE